MTLTEELSLRKPLENLAQEAVLSIFATTSRIKKAADIFFREHALTDVQFNLMILLKYQTGEEEGLTQAELGRMMLVNRANITSLIDRMERDGRVRREEIPGDRRCNRIVLTAKGRRALEQVEGEYFRRLQDLMSVLGDKEQRDLIRTLARIREKLEKMP